MLVIDGVLTALGWDVTDPACVWLEHRVNGNKMDYVLRASTGQSLAVVEAKPSGSGYKDKDRRQASGYATEIGARYAVLTNGGRWEAWEFVQQVPRKDSMLVEVHLATGRVGEIAAKLEKLHREILEVG
ncbi:MAG: type I restriction enzyme HsdR N-terminal domain-containing protein [Chloroflexi bacterium]|nr:type I restriction enzyme HsdR N-terminal domain-containing protein [Chloroflexota bacterium]